MKRIFYGLCIIFLITFLPSSCTPDPVKVALPEKIVADADNAGLTLPPRFGAFKVVENLGLVRHIAVTTQGYIYLKIMGKVAVGKGIIRLADTSGDGKCDKITGFSN